MSPEQDNFDVVIFQPLQTQEKWLLCDLGNSQVINENQKYNKDSYRYLPTTSQMEVSTQLGSVSDLGFPRYKSLIEMIVSCIPLEFKIASTVSFLKWA